MEGSSQQRGGLGFVRCLTLAELHLVTGDRPLFDRYDRSWPADFAAVAPRRLAETLGIDATAWLR